MLLDSPRIYSVVCVKEADVFVIKKNVNFVFCF